MTTKKKLKQIVCCVLLVILLLPGRCHAETSCLKLGHTAPDFVLEDLNENKIRLYDYFGRKKMIVIIIWGVWCPYCRALIVKLKGVYNKYHEDGLEVLAVSIRESPFKVSIFINKLKPGFQVLIDEWADLKEPYGVRDVPRVVILDTNGVITYSNIVTSSVDVVNIIEEAMGRPGPLPKKSFNK